MTSDRTFLVFGGSGLVGTQIVREISRQLSPTRIIVASLFQSEVEEFLTLVRGEFPNIEFDGTWGNVFVRKDFAQASRHALLNERPYRDGMYEDLHGPMAEAYGRSFLVDVVNRFKPDVLVDCINTATGISYQDVFSQAQRTRDGLRRVREAARDETADLGEALTDLETQVETTLISQSTSQLIRHVLMLHQALREAGTRLYVKVGTTGTGGMGLNIPYTHSEDKPSAQLMAKTAMAFAHTGLLFLMARTPDGPLVKELKPAAMIGYRRVAHQTVRQGGKPKTMFQSRVSPLTERLQLRQDESGYEKRGNLALAGVDTGENGFFARGEFETITYLDQMEFVTPEEIAQQVVLEIKGSNTGIDVIAGIDSNIISPSYRAGVLRHTALEKLARIEEETGTHSVAVGQLGPPELSKLLYEAYALKLSFGTLQLVLETSTTDLSRVLHEFFLKDDELRTAAVSIGVPILTPDGKELIRGPRINIPESIYDHVALDPEDVDRWAKKGWIDLRPANMDVWKRRFQVMQVESDELQTEGTASISGATYLHGTIEIGAVVAWIFRNEEGGYRIKG